VIEKGFDHEAIGDLYIRQNRRLTFTGLHTPEGRNPVKTSNPAHPVAVYIAC
jgi:hypothetical protein